MTAPIHLPERQLTTLTASLRALATQGPAVVGYLHGQGVPVDSLDQLSRPAGIRGLVGDQIDALRAATALFGDTPFTGRLAGFADDLNALRAMGLKGTELAAVVDILSCRGTPPSVMRNAVLGFGTMGRGIAYKSAIEGIEVVVYEEDARARRNSRLEILKELAEGVAEGHFTSAEAQAIFARIHITENLDETVTSTSLIHEAIFEDFDKKVELLKKVLAASDRINGREAGPVIATNTSALSVKRLGEAFGRPERVVGIHFFNPVPRNRLAEVIRGDGSDRAVALAEQVVRNLRKTSIETSDSAGFAVNRLFAPWYNEAIKLLEEIEGDLNRKIQAMMEDPGDMLCGVGIDRETRNRKLQTLRENLRSGLIGLIDTVYRETFRCGMGPFELINFTGKPQKEHGLPVAYHTQVSLYKAFGDPYKPARLLEEQFKADIPWDLSFKPAERLEAFRTELIDHGLLSADDFNRLKERITQHALGVEFLIAEKLIEEGVVTPRDLDIGVRVGLRRAGPIETMERLGMERVRASAALAAEKTGLPKPIRLFPPEGSLALGGEDPTVLRHLEVRTYPLVTLTVSNRIATITINRPEASNALNEAVLTELEALVTKAQEDDNVDIIVLKGRGKDFVAGADLGGFIRNIRVGNVGANMAFTDLGHRVLKKIEESRKMVVAVVDGAAIGGGAELALTADLVVVTPRAHFALPEVGLGLIPGFGGIWSVGHRAGIGVARAMVLGDLEPTGALALELGLADYLITDAAQEEAVLSAIAKLVGMNRGTLASHLIDTIFRHAEALALYGAQGSSSASLSWRPRKPGTELAGQTALQLIADHRSQMSFPSGLQAARQVLPAVFGDPSLLRAITGGRG